MTNSGSCKTLASASALSQRSHAGHAKPPISLRRTFSLSDGSWMPAKGWSPSIPIPQHPGSRSGCSSRCRGHTRRSSLPPAQPLLL